MYAKRRTMMRTTALALTAFLALSGTAAANDFAATLHYPETSPHAQATERKSLDRISTHSIVSSDVRRHAASESRKAAEPTTDSRRSGIEINPWIVPSFR
jgi:hypothetical protein